MATVPGPAKPIVGTTAVRTIGRFELRELEGRSQRTMAWRVFDPKVGQEMLLVLPRVPPSTAETLDAWNVSARLASRLEHPQISRAVEVGMHERSPYVLYPLDGEALSQKMSWSGLSPQTAATYTAELGRALAFMHDAGALHGDLQAYLVRVGEGGRIRVAGWHVAGPILDSTASVESETEHQRQLREAAKLDVAMLGLLFHWMLTGKPALGEPDTGQVLERLPPKGSDIVRLPPPSTLRLPLPIRVISNRATERQPQFRYRSARALLTALEGWLQSQQGDDEDVSIVALVTERLEANGLLPASVEARERLSRLQSMADERAHELAEFLMEDLGITLRLLREVNLAQLRDPRLMGSGSVLALRRALTILGLIGVYQVARSVKTWPGGLQPAAAQALENLLFRVRCAGHVAQALRPRGYDGEVIYIIAVLQNLGRLVIQYHFADEAEQMANLMRPSAGPGDTAAPDHQLSEETACFAVLGMDIDTVGVAAKRFLGLDSETLAICRRLPLKGTVYSTRDDGEILRMTASCANEAIDALQWPAPKAASELSMVVQRYGRAMGLTAQILKGVLQPYGLEDDVIRLWFKKKKRNENEEDDPFDLDNDL